MFLAAAAAAGGVRLIVINCKVTDMHPRTMTKNEYAQKCQLTRTAVRAPSAMRMRSLAGPKLHQAIETNKKDSFGMVVKLIQDGRTERIRMNRPIKPPEDMNAGEEKQSRLGQFQ